MYLPKKILLAEDDKDDQDFFHDFLQEREDILLLPIASNGEELLEYLDNTTELPDAIILDQNMPKLNGLQTLQQLKITSRYSDITVMVYSTSTDDNLIKESNMLGATLVVSKPSSYKGYQRMIDELISHL
ncbi:response regulator [Chitinophaga niabensis]|uniref:Response regulator receiver domain-containing protein n=1 Tax=Chitinophaga niabensis TaxID=536979 RepID=A0A1N6DZL6_9BACT|nr:response regulator [Chitinophaga niabensis]SIN76193.1 Response regulator receiver domain-containing protein [Chitinophaga niabensis]